MSSLFSSSRPPASPSPPSSDAQTAIIGEVQKQGAVNNLRALIEKLNDHCFEKCIGTPGSSLSKKENACLNTCMEKYLDTWNVVSRTYVNRISSQAQSAGQPGRPGGSWGGTGDGPSF